MYDITSVKTTIALIVSITVAVFQIFGYINKRNEAKKYSAPVFNISSVKVVEIEDGRKYEFPEQYSKPSNCEFIFEKRHFLDKKIIDGGETESVSEKPEMHLLIDVCPKDSMAKKAELINLNKVTIENMGFDATCFEIKKIEIHRQIGEILNIVPARSDHHKMTTRIDQSQPLEFYTTFYHNIDSGVFDFILAKEEGFSLKNKFKNTGGELLNSRLEEMVDLWTKIDIHIECENKYSERYKQIIGICIADNRYFSTREKPIKI